LGGGDALYGNHNTGQMPEGVVWPFYLGKGGRKYAENDDKLINHLKVLFLCAKTVFAGEKNIWYSQWVGLTSEPLNVYFF
jgi:hypothetical protein